jgi:2,5-diketo-D-gluconate reductase A
MKMTEGIENENKSQLLLNSGYMIPLIGFGTYGLTGDKCVNTVSLAINTGYRLVDTAPMYENETEVGSGIAQGLSVTGLHRDQLFITSKVSEDMSRKETVKSVIESLRKMELDYLDLVLIHEPYDSFKEMYAGLEECVSRNLVHSIGISNFNSEEYLELLKNCSIIPAVNQVECHIYHRNLKWKEILNRKGTLMQGYAPLTQGKKDIYNEPVLRSIAENHQRTVSQVALRSLTQTGTPVIVKSGGAGHMKENLESLNFDLYGEELEKIYLLDKEPSLFGWD